MKIKKITACIAAITIVFAGAGETIPGIAGFISPAIVASAEETYSTGVTETQIENAANEFISNKITDSMSTYDKVKEIVKFLSNGVYCGLEEHDDTASVSYDYIVTKKGNCDASAQSIRYLCSKLGIQSYYRTAKYDYVQSGIASSVSDHRNVVVNIDGVSYIADIYFNGSYVLQKASNYVSFYGGKGSCDGKWVYRIGDTGELKGKVIVGEFLGFNEKDIVFPTELGGKTVDTVYNIINWADKDSIESITIPDGMDIDTDTTNIFAGMKNLKSVSLGKNVTRLTEWCFHGCGNLTTINLDNIKEYGAACFNGCRNLEEREIYIDSSITVAEGAFNTAPFTLYIADDSTIDYRIGSAKLVYCYSTSPVYNYCKQEGIPYILIDAGSVVEMKDCTIEVAPVSYTGSAVTPAVTVKDGNGNIVPSSCYTLTYLDDCVEVGQGRVKVVGDESYLFGQTIQYFKIEPADIGSANITFSSYSYDYTGSAIAPIPTITFNGKTLERSTDYYIGYKKNTNAGTASAVIAGFGKYFNGQVEIPFTIKPRDISSGTISNFSDSRSLGSHTQSISLSVNGKTLKKDTDYTVSYMNVDKPGTATMIVEGKGNYSGSISKTYQIKAGIYDCDVSVSDAELLNGTAIPNVVVKYDGTVLTENKDYKVSFSDNTKTGYGFYEITGMGAYEGTYSGYFYISNASLSSASVQVADQTYTGSALTPSVTVTLGGKSLINGTDYTVAYSNNTNAGTATVTITGKGSYDGKVTKTFNILAKSMSALTVSLGANSFSYTGSAITPSVTVKDGTKTLVAGTDYTLSYTGNVNPGTGYVKITGTGNYAGTVSKSFTIGRTNIAMGRSGAT